jgi:hypothetical protein
MTEQEAMNARVRERLANDPTPSRVRDEDAEKVKRIAHQERSDDEAS